MHRLVDHTPHWQTMNKTVAQHLEQTGDPLEARKYWQKTVDNNPWDPRMLVSLARSLWKYEPTDRKLALKYMTRALSIQNWLRIGGKKKTEKQLVKFKSYLTKWFEYQPYYLLKDEKPDEAKWWIEKAEEFKPDDPIVVAASALYETKYGNEIIGRDKWSRAEKLLESNSNKNNIKKNAGWKWLKNQMIQSLKQ